MQAHEEFYGKKFLVATPLENGGKDNNYKWIDQDRREEFSWSLSDSGWMGEELKKRIPDKKFYDNYKRQAEARAKDEAEAMDKINSHYLAQAEAEAQAQAEAEAQAEAQAQSQPKNVF